MTETKSIYEFKKEAEISQGIGSHCFIGILNSVTFLVSYIQLFFAVWISF